MRYHQQYYSTHSEIFLTATSGWTRNKMFRFYPEIHPRLREANEDKNTVGHRYGEKLPLTIFSKSESLPLTAKTLNRSLSLSL